MSIKTRVEWSGVLVAQSPVCVAGIAVGDLDMSPVLNGAGVAVLPGTSLTGALRSHLSVTDGTIFGSQEQISGVQIDDAPLLSDTGFEIRDGVGIERFSGTAADGVKFSRLVVSSGAEFGFHLTADLDDPSLIQPFIDALCADEGITLGGATTRGLGRVRLIDAVASSWSWDRDGVLDALSGKKVPNSETAGELSAHSSAAASNSQSITANWTALGPVLVASGSDGNAVDTFPLVSRNGDLVRLVIPGSSIKGAFRSQAERIERTVRAAHGSEHSLPDNFLDQMSDPNTPVTARLFGQSRNAQATNAQTDAPEAAESGAGDSAGRVGALTVSDCLSQWSCQQQQWAKLINTESGDSTDREGPLRTLLTKEAFTSRDRTKPESAEFQAGFHVGIDRWTGAPVDGALYSVLEPHSVSWQPLRLTLDLDRLGTDSTALAARFLLLLILRDFCEGWIPLGFGTHRGYGDLRCDPSEVTFSNSPDIPTLRDAMSSGSVSIWQKHWLTETGPKPAEEGNSLS
jgi:CRISPR/Cas system CSM-associated protein Csm3 (group 7 of RAMP superfamily)